MSMRSTQEAHAHFHGGSIGCEAISFSINGRKAFGGSYGGLITSSDPCEEFIEFANDGWYPVNGVEGLVDEVYGQSSTENVKFFLGSVFEPLKHEVPVVFACNVFDYIPEEKHLGAIKTIAEYNTGLLGVTGVKEEVLRECGYTPYEKYAAYIPPAWKHTPQKTKEQKQVIWEKYGQDKAEIN